MSNALAKPKSTSDPSNASWIGLLDVASQANVAVVVCDAEERAIGRIVRIMAARALDEGLEGTGIVSPIENHVGLFANAGLRPGRGRIHPCLLYTSPSPRDS